jgi:hypothetical protein
MVFFPYKLNMFVTVFCDPGAHSALCDRDLFCRTGSILPDGAANVVMAVTKTGVLSFFFSIFRYSAQSFRKPDAEMLSQAKKTGKEFARRPGPGLPELHPRTCILKLIHNDAVIK